MFAATDRKEKQGASRRTERKWTRPFCSHYTTAITQMNESYFLCWAEDRRVQMSATMTTTTMVTAPTETTMMTSRLLFFWGVALPWGGRIWPMGFSEKHRKVEVRRYVTLSFLLTEVRVWGLWRSVAANNKISHFSKSDFWVRDVSAKVKNSSQIIHYVWCLQDKIQIHILKGQCVGFSAI